MPIGDTVFKRLEAATGSELEAITKALEMPLTKNRKVDEVAISKELRAAGGNSFANLFRDDHELDYREVLADVAHAAASNAGFRRPDVDNALEEWIEDYVVVASAFASRPDRTMVSDDNRLRAQMQAEAAMRGVVAAAGPDAAGLAGLGILAAGGVAVALGVAALPFGIAFVAFSRASPAVRRTLPATLAMIQVRKRLEAEASLREAAAE